MRSINIIKRKFEDIDKRNLNKVAGGVQYDWEQLGLLGFPRYYINFIHFLIILDQIGIIDGVNVLEGKDLDFLIDYISKNPDTEFCKLIYTLESELEDHMKSMEERLSSFLESLRNSTIFFNELRTYFV